MSYSSDRLYRQIVFSIVLVAFPIALVIFAFSSCEVRKRSEKKACRDGDVNECLYVAKYYDDKSDGIIGFLMSNSDTALEYYYRACRLKSSTGCDRMMYVRAHGEQAKNQSTEEADIADALIESCIARVDGACLELRRFMADEQWVANRSAQAFERQCEAGQAEACKQIDITKSDAVFDRDCRAGDVKACEQLSLHAPKPE